MTVHSLRAAQKAQTRDKLKQAGLACFTERGYGATSIADVTGKAGVALGTFYVHFADKGALVDELLHEFNAGLVARVAERVPFEAAPLEPTVRTLAEIFLDYWAEHRAFIGVYSQRAAAGIASDALRAGVNPEMAAFLRARLKGLLGGAVDDARLELTLHGLLAFWLRVGMQYLYSPDYPRPLVVETLAGATAATLTSLLGDRHGKPADRP